MKTLQVGDSVPNFSVLDQSGKPFILSDYQNTKLIVFFYPKANTPGCTTEACNLRDHYSELKVQGFDIVGVSADDQKKQASFKDKYQFPFPLLADTEKVVLEAFGVWGPKKFMGKEYDGIHRMTFVIENGRVIKVINKVQTKDHAAQILE
ncbi:MAG: thioredoxin-dependent thiol peroxidase [Flavobacteriaceae bacterium]|jgi:peroxiredoxin Q/BCP|tara:strand:+ start:77584 stop:78033 length:450 start_codon:yes stop_codon:yes gene_type:complete